MKGVKIRMYKFMSELDYSEMNNDQRKKYRQYLHWFNDIEYKKYLKILDNVKQSIEKGDKRNAEHGLYVASMQLRLCANIRNRKGF